MGATKPRPRPTQRTRAAQPAHVTKGTRDAILERAVELASVEGLEGLTIGRLAAELEMSKSGLFGHFGSKEELQLATIQAAAGRFVHEVVEPTLAEPEGASRLRALCEGYVSHLERRVFPGGCFWGAVTTEFDGRPGPVRDRIRDAFGAGLAELDRQAAIAGADDPAQVAFELQALIQSANSSFQLFGDRTAFRRARKGIERLLLPRRPAPRSRARSSQARKRAK
jgi:AcrR family transcriptional regulator